ncbi:flavin-containing monooxygenase [Sphingomonas crocodyli]|uniref:NAD(P)/FAD-dependent oxidoreductase n=1 Tax=Sphingomonas crocodyli TaxID=1979270 RepID=A0A437M6C2_9SPHN|nr:NAD(P)/FAD-dependent oxidoreductase [Sphingomonas crocodyli]RVT93271.1 NAD(P)/FAD-dependent oxidoreductase [Sphingomonas crocodyli]
MADEKKLRVVVIGAGMSGILAAIRLRDEGIDDVTVYEKADRVGGTWRENTYPGLTCDVQSHAYTYSFELNPDWSSQYPDGAEIYGYFERTAQKYGVIEMIRFGEEITKLAFVDGRWEIETKKGTKDTADVVIAATGVLHHPSTPDIPGLASFEGASFHSARWDHSVPLDGARVGVIGTGSTGVQIVAALADRSAVVKQFQRTAQWVRKGVNDPYTPEQRAAFREDPNLILAIRNSPESEANVRLWSQAISDASSPEMHMMEGYIAQNLEQNVADPVLREKLRPNYRAGCKRIVISPNYYEQVQKPSVEIVTDAIDRVEPKGVRTADGTLHELDVLVLATGFHADMFLRPMTVTGRNGVNVEAVWADRPIAYMGLSIPDFPNLFMLNGPTAPVGNFSLIDVAERQMDYLMGLIDMLRTGKAREISADAKAMADYESARAEAASKTIFASGCRSWYLGADGAPSIWPWTYDHFIEEMKTPKLDAFDVVEG